MTNTLELNDIMDPLNLNFGEYFELSCDRSINKITAVNSRFFCRFDITQHHETQLLISYKVLDNSNYDILNESTQLLEIDSDQLTQLLYDFISLSLQAIIVNF